jgi:hypothetical protein
MLTGILKKVIQSHRQGISPPLAGGHDEEGEGVMTKGKKVGFIGGGKMGEALAGGIVSRGLFPASHIMVSDVVKERLEQMAGAYGIATTTDNKRVAREADILILAVKPQNMGDVLNELNSVLGNERSKYPSSCGYFYIRSVYVRYGKSHCRSGKNHRHGADPVHLGHSRSGDYFLGQSGSL